MADDARWAAGQGQEVCGPIGAQLLLLTGRLGALPPLSGPGVAGLRGPTAWRLVELNGVPAGPARVPLRGRLCPQPLRCSV